MIREIKSSSEFCAISVFVFWIPVSDHFGVFCSSLHVSLFSNRKIPDQNVAQRSGNAIVSIFLPTLFYCLAFVTSIHAYLSLGEPFLLVRCSGQISNQSSFHSRQQILRWSRLLFTSCKARFSEGTAIT